MLHFHRCRWHLQPSENVWWRDWFQTSLRFQAVHVLLTRFLYPGDTSLSLSGVSARSWRKAKALSDAAHYSACRFLHVIHEVAWELFSTTANKIKCNQPKLQCCVLSKLALVLCPWFRPYSSQNLGPRDPQTSLLRMNSPCCF